MWVVEIYFFKNSSKWRVGDYQPPYLATEFVNKPSFFKITRIIVLKLHCYLFSITFNYLFIYPNIKSIKFMPSIKFNNFFPVTGDHFRIQEGSTCGI